MIEFHAKVYEARQRYRELHDNQSPPYECLDFLIAATSFIIREDSYLVYTSEGIAIILKTQGGVEPYHDVNIEFFHETELDPEDKPVWLSYFRPVRPSDNVLNPNQDDIMIINTCLNTEQAIIDLYMKYRADLT